MVTKRELMFSIADFLDLPRVSPTRGSSIPKSFMASIAEKFSLNGNLKSTEILREVLHEAGLPWQSSFDSESTPSGGGETITLEGLKALLEAVRILEPTQRDANELAMSTATMLDSAEWSIIPGQSLQRKALHDKYGGVRQGGISPSNSSANIFLFFDKAEANAHGYVEDGWANDERGIFNYSAEGQSGDQIIARYNKSVLEHKESKKTLRVFEGVRGDVVYLGAFELASPPFRLIQGIGRDGIERDAIVFRLQKLDAAHFDILPAGPGPVSTHMFGTQYAWASEDPSNFSLSEPFTNDPDALDRATLAHASTQNAVAEWLTEAGLEPLSPGPYDPPFDIAWQIDERKFIAEIKSLTPMNEPHQIRLGIGQVLDYCQFVNAEPLLITSERPTSDRWREVCIQAGIVFLDVAELSIITPNSIGAIPGLS